MTNREMWDPAKSFFDLIKDSAGITVSGSYSYGTMVEVEITFCLWRIFILTTDFWLGHQVFLRPTLALLPGRRRIPPSPQDFPSSLGCSWTRLASRNILIYIEDRYRQKWWRVVTTF